MFARSATFGLTNGGTAVAIFLHSLALEWLLFQWRRWHPCMKSLAQWKEFVDMKILRAPTAGGQYHWVSEVSRSHLSTTIFVLRSTFTVRRPSYSETTQLRHWSTKTLEQRLVLY